MFHCVKQKDTNAKFTEVIHQLFEKSSSACGHKFLLMSSIAFMHVVCDETSAWVLLDMQAS